MANQMTLSKAHLLAGMSFPENIGIDGENAFVSEVTVPVAEGGDLSTRSDDDEGTITMDESAHSIDTGDRIDIYWTGGRRRGVTVGTVSGAAVPFSGGAGDVLPSSSTNVTVALPVSVDVSVVTGANVKGILLYIDQLGQFVLADSTTEKASQVVGAAQVWDWNEEDGTTNPLTGDSIDTIFVSQDSTTDAATARIGILYDN